MLKAKRVRCTFLESQPDHSKCIEALRKIEKILTKFRYVSEHGARNEEDDEYNDTMYVVEQIEKVMK
jgi:hypothetical protein